MHYDDIEDHKYAEFKKHGTINKKFSPAMGHENKQKFSLFGQIIRSGNDS